MAESRWPVVMTAVLSSRPGMPLLLVAGAILALLGMMGHAVGGRRHYF
jgi:hypothetical protein